METKNIETLFTLSSLRARLKLSREIVASRIGISVPTLMSWERDSTSLGHDMVQKFAKMYSVNKEWIFFGNEKKFNQFLRKRGGFE